jgi:hypothetical protein
MEIVFNNNTKMKFLCTAIVFIILCCTIIDGYCSSLYASVYDILFPLGLALFVDGYNLSIARWIIVAIYIVLICTYMVSWGQKLL